MDELIDRYRVMCLASIGSFAYALGCAGLAVYSENSSFGLMSIFWGISSIITGREFLVLRNEIKLEDRVK